MQDSHGQPDRGIGAGQRAGTTVGGPVELHRVVRGSTLGATDELARHRRGLLTGVSVVVPAGPDATAQVETATGWAPPELRVELVLVEPAASLTERLDMLAWPWVAVRGATDRAGSLDAATTQCSGAFVIITGSAGRPPFERLGAALGAMWVNGADALILGSADDTSVGGFDPDELLRPADGTDRRGERLAAALGVRPGSAGLVVLRRWVARFLFDGIDRAIDPLAEIEERVRLLELRLIEVVDPA